MTPLLSLTLSLSLLLGQGLLKELQAAEEPTQPTSSPGGGASSQEADLDEEESEPTGVLVHKPSAFCGYTLIAPLGSTTINLIDMEGNVVHKWETGYAPGSEYLLENGNLLRCSLEPDAPRFEGGGKCGRLQEIAWDGTVIWDYRFASGDFLQHHDIQPTSYGTILFIAWEHIDKKQALKAGRHPAYVPDDGFWPDFVVEIEPLPPDDAEVIWEWHVLDHVIQDLNPSLETYGNVPEHPERIDINADIRQEELSGEDVEELAALGYISDTPSAEELEMDWLHTNAIHYNEDLDQIVLSVPHMNEIWIIDHSTTIGEAATDAGGNSGMGGRLLYRWGNPRNYQLGTKADQQLWYQHDAHWIADGLPGAGKLLLYNNGGGRPDGDYSSILELVPPLDPDGTYARGEYAPFGPQRPHWSYEDKENFFSGFISGVQRLPNGNTLICEGVSGRVFEVTRAGEVVWEFVNGFGEESPAGAANPAPPKALFRAQRFAPDHPGLQGKVLPPPATE